MAPGDFIQRDALHRIGLRRDRPAASMQGDLNPLEKTMIINPRVSLIAAAAAISMSSGHALAHDISTETTGAVAVNPLAEAVRKANDRFKDVAAAVKEGYAPIPCASAATGNGAMGIHYVNGGYLKDDAVDLAKPEAVMYEPMSDGTMQLVAVEYITAKGPAALGGQLFSFTSAPNRYGLGPFYELHVWAWKHNPTGAFADNNPDVSCEAAKAEAK